MNPPLVTPEPVLKAYQGIKPGDMVSNQQLCEIFGCSPQGGMRRAHKTKSLVLISDHTKAIYEDRWINDIFHYTGMGLTGNQSLTFMQNKTLADSKNIDIRVALFEVFEEGDYVYIGEVELAGKPYIEKQPDIENNIRDVYVFPLKMKDTKAAPPIKQEIIEKKEADLKKKIRKLSLEELEFRAQFALKGVGKREVTSTTYERNQIVAELAKRRAKGICQLCEKPAPFKNPDGEPYLETHHFEWLAKGGKDVIENTVALCPNCHRKVHILNLKSDEATLKSKLSKKV
jgi:5-methylcytosine-specific restriction protein A